MQKIKAAARQYAVLLSLLFAVAAVGLSMTELPYENIDNYLVSIVINGLLGTDTYCQYLSYPLCAVLGLLARFVPAADVYLLAVRLVLLLLFWWCAWLALRYQPRGSAAVLLCLVLLAGMRVPTMNYTVYSALFAAAGLFTLLAAAGRSAPRIFYIAGGCFLCVGFLWRLEGALLVLPFGALYFFLRCLLDKKLPDCRKIAIPLLLCAVLLAGDRLVARRAPSYAPGFAYDAARQSLSDYPRYEYAEVKDQLPGVTENDYNTASTLLADTDRVTADYLQALNAVSRKPVEWPTAAGAVQGVQQVYHMFTQEDPRTRWLYQPCWMLLLFILLSSGAWLTKLAAVCGFGGAWLICLYFQLAGRLPARVCQSVLACALAFLLAVWLQTAAMQPAGRKQGARLAVWLAGTAFCAFFGLRMAKDMAADYKPAANYTPFAERVQADEGEYAETSAGTARYMWSVWEYDTVALATFQAQGKLPTRTFLLHHFPWGDWTYGQAYSEQYFAAIGTQNPMADLLARQDSYFVGPSADGVLTTLQEHYAPDTQAVQVGQIGGVPVWQFRSAS